MDVASKEKTYSVREAKQRLRLASAQFDPFAFIKRKPLHITGGAFLAGLAWGWLRRGKAAAGLLPLAVQMLVLAARWGLPAKQR